ncbi:unnamed protein product [Calicophoron daubneyi]|uniref:C2H2-type domain-containing protein n=1 Tax=Calicophoron daubneyi TaxID=300641 RepID=A0AAV2TDX8_CALDB
MSKDRFVNPPERRMTHATRSLRRPPLSVRTRALTQKAHERIANRSVLSWTSKELRLRHRSVMPDLNTVASTYPGPHIDICHSTDPVLVGQPAPRPEFSLHSTYPSDSDHHSLVPSLSSNGSSNCASFTFSSSSACSTSSVESGLSACKWEGCEIPFVEQAQLVTHLQEAHVLPQLLSNRRKCFWCLWKGCRVFRRPSVSAAWLEQHILHHTDARGKPFRCIFDSCTMRFSTSMLLERHVQRTHMRATRTRTGALLPDDNVDPKTAGVSGLCLNSEKPLVPQSDLKSESVGIPRTGRRCLRRRRRLRFYRVRRVDFYDVRSSHVIQNRLQILKLLKKQQKCELSPNVEEIPASSLREQTYSENESTSYVLPRPLSQFAPSKPRLRSSDNPISGRITVDSPLGLIRDADVHLLGNMEKRRHTALLLTLPHVFAGQRLSTDNQTEYLVRWSGGIGMGQYQCSTRLKLRCHIWSQPG